MSGKDERLDVWIGEIPDILATLETVREDLACAETVETVADFKANIRSARKVLADLVKELDELL